MDCPKYANIVTVTHNTELNEMVINFFHEFPVVENPVDPDGKVQVSVGREHVGGVLLHDQVAYQFIDLLKKHLSEGEKNE